VAVCFLGAFGRPSFIRAGRSLRLVMCLVPVSWMVVQGAFLGLVPFFLKNILGKLPPPQTFGQFFFLRFTLFKNIGGTIDEGGFWLGVEIWWFFLPGRTREHLKASAFFDGLFGGGPSDCRSEPPLFVHRLALVPLPFLVGGVALHIKFLSDSSVFCLIWIFCNVIRTVLHWHRSCFP